jgi:peptidoglycan/xylan/chitin deacetylase (PgdA/CDA1 family)
MTLEQWCLSKAEQIGLLRVYTALRQRLKGAQIAIIMYHRVSPIKDDLFYPPIAPAVFENQIKYIKANFIVLSIEELIAHLKSSDPLPERAVVITFDDGYKDNFLYAYPILRKFDLPATIFLSTGHIDTGRLLWWDTTGYVLMHTSQKEISLKNLGTYSIRSRKELLSAMALIGQAIKKMSQTDRSKVIKALLDSSGIPMENNLGRELMLSWSEIREMSNYKISFGAHTVNHPILTKEPLEVVRNEIIQSKRDIEERVGVDVTIFAYPNGYFNTEIMGIVKEIGFTCALATLPNRLVSRGDDMYALNRIAAFSNFHLFKAMLTGIAGDFNR